MTQEEIKDIALCGETSTVQFKQELTSQKEIAKEMIAFANSHGGRIFFGIADKTGELTGLTYEEIQLVSRELGNAANEQVKPTIYIETEVVRVDDKHVLVCSITEGRNKPYKNLQGEIWVKQGADKRRITENAEILALFQDSGSYRPEEDAEKGSSIKDLEMAYIREYFETTYDKEVEDFDQPLDRMLHSLSVLTPKGEATRVGMLFFGKNPQRYEPSVVVKAVAFAGNDIGDTNYLDSRDITGTLPRMFKESMAFLKSYLHHEQKGQNFNSTGHTRNTRSGVGRTPAELACAFRPTPPCRHSPVDFQRPLRNHQSRKPVWRSEDRRHQVGCLSSAQPFDGRLCRQSHDLPWTWFGHQACGA